MTAFLPTDFKTDFHRNPDKFISGYIAGQSQIITLKKVRLL